MRYAEIVVQKPDHVTTGDIIEVYEDDIHNGVYKVMHLSDDGEAMLVGIGSKAGCISMFNFS